MCRFIVYVGTPVSLAELITEPTNSLIHQSFSNLEREEPLNGDGFGVAWYEPGRSESPGLFRSVSPAWNNRNLRELSRLTVSPCALAHVRAASRGLAVTEANCHPFTHGPWAFMHNGEVGGFARIRRELLGMLSDEAFQSIEGTTDSEHMFALFLDRMRSAAGRDTVERLATALRSTIRTIVRLSVKAGSGEPSYLNLAVSNGQGAAVCRVTTDPDGFAASLHVHAGRRYVCREGRCCFEDPGADCACAAVVVSSECLSEDAGWQTVPVNHLVVIRPGGMARIDPLGSLA